MSMLEGAPWLLAHKSMLSVNQPLKLSLYGTDYVVWRDSLDNINALPNICPHMGAMLSEGWCEEQKDKTSVIVCPFHALEFDHAGCTILPGKHQKTLSQLLPLKLIIQGDFIWTYGGYEPKISIPNILNEINQNYEFIGYVADTSVPTDLHSMLLNMHDYNHQNGTHRELFKITEVKFKKFIDKGYWSEAFFDTPTAPSSFWEKLQNPSLFMLPSIIEAHLENHFPSLVIFYGDNSLAKIAQCHLFVPESINQTRTYILLFAQKKSLLFNLFQKQFLKLSQTIVEQDARILGQIYTNSKQTIKLNNEIGMDWVKRNFSDWSDS